MLNIERSWWSEEVEVVGGWWCEGRTGQDGQDKTGVGGWVGGKTVTVSDGGRRGRRSGRLLGPP